MSERTNKLGCLTIFALALLVFTAYSKLSGPDKAEDYRLKKDGVIGVWLDTMGNAETTIERIDLREFKLIRKNSDGSGGEYELSLEGSWLLRNDKFGTKYLIDGDVLEVHDRDGFIRSMKLIDKE